MTAAVKKISPHSYITKKKSVCGGRSIVRGTRIPVWSLIQWYKQGMTIEDIMREFPQLKPAQVHDAFSYYYDNLKEIEKDIAENEVDRIELVPMRKIKDMSGFLKGIDTSVVREKDRI